MEQIRKEFNPNQNKFINLSGKLISLSQPLVMGIVNITPDSYVAQSRAKDVKETIKIVENMLSEGAGMIDLGAQSTRPGAKEISEEEELGRISGLIKALVHEFPELPVSVDTYRSSVAKMAVNEGAAMINDISGGDFDADMHEFVASKQIPYIMMHTPAKPETMQLNPKYDDVVSEIAGRLSQKALKLQRMGVKDIILDPGIGFGKTVEHNFEIIQKLGVLAQLGYPILIGLSRKSLITKTLGISSGDALNGTSALHMLALQNGASILRVHDVKPAVECVRLWQQFH